AVRLARLALPGMRARGEGRIVNISSLASRTTTPMTGWYQAAGRALEAVSDALRAEVEDHGIDVVLVAPGAHRTSIWSRAAGDLEVRRRATAHPEAYERALRVLHDLESGAADAAGVARVVGDALVAGHPEARYRVGREPA